MPATRAIDILVHLPESEAQRQDAAHIAEAMRNYFACRAEVVGWELRELFRIGRVSLTIGLTVLASCIVLGRRQSRAPLPRRVDHPGLGCELAASGNLPVRLVAGGAPAVPVVNDATKG